MNHTKYLIITDDDDFFSFAVSDIASICIVDRHMEIERYGMGVRKVQFQVDNPADVARQIRDQLAPDTDHPTAQPDYDVLRISRVVRGETQNSGSPIWRCYAEDDRQVNFFKHEDPAKNTYPVLQRAGWADVFDEMEVGEEYTLSPRMIVLCAPGKFRTPLVVVPKPDNRPVQDILDSALNKLDTLDRIRNSSPLDEDDTETEPGNDSEENHIPF
jgi:hypothetical protein